MRVNFAQYFEQLGPPLNYLKGKGTQPKMNCKQRMVKSEHNPAEISCGILSSSAVSDGLRGAVSHLSRLLLCLHLDKIHFFLLLVLVTLDVVRPVFDDSED